MNYELEEITFDNVEKAYEIDRSDIPEDFVDGVPNLIENLEYGRDHNCIGHAFLIKKDGHAIGTIPLGEGIVWDTDPLELKNRDFYRLVFFVLDKNYRSQGIGAKVLEDTVQRVYKDFGEGPIVLGVHKDNVDAERFYKRHGFAKTEYMEGNDYYYIRGL
ncbi:MAG: GNAT family N-acetyltransferase [Clostridiales bacterium]|nr:GNAT family N-acetyltransferase [Clostridiales bacterium]